MHDCLKRHSVDMATDIIPLRIPSILSIRAPPDTDTPTKDVQIGFPKVPNVGDPLYFGLLREWLRVCDEDRKHWMCRPFNKTPPLLPTRVLVLEDNDDVECNQLRLVDTRGERGDYVALSYCWGKLTDDERERWTTTRKTYDARQKGIPVDSLPWTYRDAIKVTRELGKRYLWIDALCIIQGKDGDWLSESKNMQAVFRNAYCTIAASSASTSNQGFLKPHGKPTSPLISVRSVAHGLIYVSESIDDFDQDVNKSPLNTRAWVFQERALARRTIHFSASQMYWECGAGVHCESLSTMEK